MASCAINLPSGMSRRLRAAAILAEVEAAALWNEAWYLEGASRGAELPCCAGCAGARFVKTPKSHGPPVDTAPIVARNKKADCKAAVAMSLGHERAVAIAEGMDRAEARARWTAALEPTDDPDYWHVVIHGPEGREDPTEELDR
jgi:hypothetical protein